MRFAYAMLVSGFLLIAAPLMTHAYELYVLQQIMMAIATNSQASFAAPDEPVVWYGLSSAMGLILAVLGYKLESQRLRVTPAASAPSASFNL